MEASISISQSQSMRLVKKDISHRKTLGLNAKMLNPSELNKLEPNINITEGGAGLFSRL